MQVKAEKARKAVEVILGIERRRSLSRRRIWEFGEVFVKIFLKKNNNNGKYKYLFVIFVARYFFVSSWKDKKMEKKRKTP